MKGSAAMLRGVGLAFALAVGSATVAGAPTGDGLPAQADYARDVQPLFVKYCSGCHGAQKQESGLRLDRASGIATGGDSGSTIVPGKAAESLLIQALTGADDVARMPPEGKPQPTADEVALVRAWIDAGAKLPAESLQRPGSDHWAFQPVVRRPPPPVKQADWPRNAIDRFILARLETHGIAPSPEAPRAVLIRRLSLDLLGLPPESEEVERFESDTSPDAYERLVDRLLNSSAFGERWGRHWLDLARYADSNGYTRDFGREIWKYRDWVIDAVNRDMPLDQFTIEQVAGDLLPNATLEQIVATGFHRNTLINEEGGTDDEQFRVEAVADRVDTTGAVWLGLTLGCARCHSHKYDPISQREYYQFFAFLNNCDEPTIEAPSYDQIARGDLKRRDEIRTQIAECEMQLDQQRSDFEQAQLAWERAITPEKRSSFAGPIQEALMVPLTNRDNAQKKRVEDVFKKTDEARKAFPLVERINELRASEPKIPTTMVLKSRAKPRETHVHKRGNFLDPGPRVLPGVPGVLNDLPAGLEHATRLDLARWLVAPDNPLTPRVVMNRYWQRLFGRGIVETENDFGTQGAPPTHPELLDWLASELVARGWSTKQMIRLIVTSATYRQLSVQRAELETIDPRNVYLARQSRVRLDAEVIRDAALAASGLLTRAIGGPSVFPPQPEGVFAFTQDPKPWKTATGRDRYRRGMYTYFWRSSPYPALIVFDFPDSNVTCTRRVRSNTPLQALTLANDTVFMECAQAMAARAIREGPDATPDRTRWLFRTCLARQPNDGELDRLMAFYGQQREALKGDTEAARQLAGSQLPEGTDPAEAAAWTACCRVLLNLDEFITRE